MVSNLPFYTRLEEDRIAYDLSTAGKLSLDGIVKKDDLDEIVYEITPEVYANILHTHEQKIKLKGRNKNIPLNITISMDEIDEVTHFVTPVKKVKTTLHGNGIWKFIQPIAEEIFKQWGSQPSSSFKRRCEADVNDFDFVLYSNAPNPNTNTKIVEDGLENNLAAKFKAKNIPPPQIAVEIAKFKQEKLNPSSSSYIQNIFKMYPQIGPTHPDLHRIFIKLHAYLKAADVINKASDIYFSQRKMGDSHTILDCTFAFKVPTTVTTHNSLFIDLSPLIEGQNKRVYLQCILGNQKRLQAISDSNLRLLTFESHSPKNTGEFARTISFLTTGGRCYQQGELQKVMAAFEKEIKDANSTLSNLLAKQLIGRLVDHHQNEPAILVALAFNASALILWMDVRYAQEIQKLWALIFSYLDKIEEEYPHQMSRPIIEHIQMMMRDPLFAFEDLYAQIQVSAIIDQHRFHNTESSYPCEPTQTDGKIFNQIKFTIPQRINKNVINSFTLFFPYDLPHAIQHLAAMTHLPQFVVNSLSQFQEVLMDYSTLSFGFEKSPLADYVKDPRRQYSICVKRIHQLLEKKHEYCWFMGYLLALTNLAQIKSDLEVKKVLNSFLCMLQENWASTQLKKIAIDILYRTLKQSDIELSIEVFSPIDNVTPLLVFKRWIYAFIQARWDPLAEIACEYLDLIEKLFTSPSQRVIFFDKVIKAALKNDIEKINIKFLQIFVPKIAHDNRFHPEAKLDWLFKIYNHPSLASIAELEKTIFHQLIYVLESIRQLDSEFSPKTKTTITNHFINLLKNKPRTDQPLKVLSLLKQLCRLKLFQQKNSLFEFWDQIILQAPQQPAEIAYIYLKECGEVVKSFKYWKSLDGSRKNSFKNLWVNSLQNYVKATGNVEKIIKPEISLELDENQRKDIKNLLIESLNQLLNKDINSFTSNDIELFLILFKQLIEEKSGDAEAPITYPNNLGINKILLRLSQLDTAFHFINDIKSIIDNYVEIHSIHDVEALASTFFALMDGISCQKKKISDFTKAFDASLFDSFFPLFANVKNNLSKEQYAQFVAILTEHLDQESADELRPIFEKYARDLLVVLHHHELWEEIVQLYIHASSLAWDDLSIDLRLILEACMHIINKKEPSTAFIDHLYASIEKIPENNRLQFDKEIDSLYEVFFNQMCAQKDYLRSLEILKKKERSRGSLDGEFYKSVFQMFTELIKEGKAREVYQSILDFETPPGYELFWLNIFQLFLNQSQPKLCLGLITQKWEFLETKDKQYKSKWMDFLHLMMEETKPLLRSEDKTILQFLEIAHGIIHKLIWNYKPKNQTLWIDYILLSAKIAPINIVEDILNEMGNGEFIKDLLEPPQRIVCWKSLLERFTINPSKAFLDIDNWWPTASREFRIGNSSSIEEDQNFLIWCLINGGIKNLENQKKPSSKQLKKIADIFLRDKTHITGLILNLDPVSILNLAKLFFCVSGPKYFHRCLLTAMIPFTFTMIEPDPIFEEMAVSFVDPCLKVAITYKDREKKDDDHDENIKLAMWNLIKLVIQSEHSMDANHFAILQYLFDIEDTDFGDITDNNAIALRINLLEKVEVLQKIFSHPWRETENEFTYHQKELISRTFKQIFKHSLTPLVVFMQDCSKRTDLKKYVNMTGSLQRKFNSAKKTHINWIVRIRSNWEVDRRLASQVGIRYGVFRSCGFADRFQLLRSEEEMYKRRTFCCAKLLAITFLFIATAIYYVYFIPVTHQDLEDQELLRRF